MLNNKETIIKILWEQGAIQFGSFTLKSQKTKDEDKGFIIKHQKIRCPLCNIEGMTLEIAPPHETPYGDEMVPGFNVSMVCDNVACGMVLSGNLYEA